MSESDPLQGGKIRLIGRLLQLFRVRRSKIHLVFDGPPDPSLAEFDNHRLGPLRISYPPSGSTADDVILRFLDNHTDLRALTVVSSDREIKDYAKNLGAKVQTCSQFNRTLKETGRLFNKIKADEKEETTLSPLELNQWMDLFNSHDKKSHR